MNGMVPERMLGLAGGTSTGKSTLERKLARMFGDELAIFPFDDMYGGRSRLGDEPFTHWEDPRLYRLDEFVGHIRDLKAGKTVEFAARSRESRAAGLENRTVEPRRLVLVAGFLALYPPEVRGLYDVTAYLGMPDDEIVRRRMMRLGSGDPCDTEAYITCGLLDAHHAVVEPQRAFAQHDVDATQPPDDVAAAVARLLR